jgi:hypothetical protein
MSTEHDDDDDSLFAVIRSSRRKPEQVARWHHAGEVPTYKLLRDPYSLSELNGYDHCLAFWRENETLTYILPRGVHDWPIFDDNQKALSLEFDESHQSGTIYIVGRSDKALADTTAFVMGIEKPAEASTYLYICPYREPAYTYPALGSQCLTRIFDKAPSRQVKIAGFTLSAGQTMFLATRPHPVHLSLCYCKIEDEGTAFVNALENRKSLFGSLDIKWCQTFHYDNLRRILQVDTLNHLEFPLLMNPGKLSLLPFSAQVVSLQHEIHSSSLVNADLLSLNIVAKKTNSQSLSRS